MKYAPITHDMDALAMVVRETQCAYHMCLAPQVLRDDHYRLAYAGLARRGHFIMLDNGAAENGTLTLSELVSAANKVGADEVVLPDAMRDADKTIALVQEAFDKGTIPWQMSCVVPQGDSVEEWCKCFDTLDTTTVFATVGVPKHLERFPQGREQAIRHIIEVGGHSRHNIHMFGVYSDLFEEVRAVTEWNMRPFIRGIDSALPFALAQRGVLLAQHNGMHVSYEWNRPFNFKTALDNVQTAMKFCH